MPRAAWSSRSCKRQECLEGVQPSSTLTLDIWPPDLLDNKFLFSVCETLWQLVIAAPGTRSRDQQPCKCLHVCRQRCRSEHGSRTEAAQLGGQVLRLRPGDLQAPAWGLHKRWTLPWHGEVRRGLEHAACPSVSGPGLGEMRPQARADALHSHSRGFALLLWSLHTRVHAQVLAAKY